MNIAVVTSNPNKVAEIASFFSGELTIEHFSMEIPEYRHDDVGEIARRKAEYAFAILERPLIVDDTSFSIEALKGFPGPYAGYVLGTLGCPGILRLMEGVTDRRASFETAIALATGSGEKVFRGRIDGTIVCSPRGEKGFGYDPIFEFGGCTLAERSLEEKSRISHRGRALSLLRDYLHSSKNG